MKTIVFGATGGTGQAVVRWLVEAGHEVTAFMRDPGRRPAILGWERVRLLGGDVMDQASVDAAVAEHDAVVVALGIRENPLLVRLRGPVRTPIDVRSVGTRNIVAAMQRHGMQRLVVLSSYGLGETRARLRVLDRLLFDLVLKPQIEDTASQERLVEDSGLDWTLIRPVHLTDGATDRLPFASSSGDIIDFAVSRGSVGRFMAQAVTDPALHRQTIALSGAGALN